MESLCASDWYYYVATPPSDQKFISLLKINNSAGGNRFDEVKNHINAYLNKSWQYSSINYTRLDRLIKVNCIIF